MLPVKKQMEALSRKKGFSAFLFHWGNNNNQNIFFSADPKVFKMQASTKQSRCRFMVDLLSTTYSKEVVEFKTFFNKK